jgi:hypothetical protein
MLDLTIHWIMLRWEWITTTIVPRDCWIFNETKLWIISWCSFRENPQISRISPNSKQYQYQRRTSEWLNDQSESESEFIFLILTEWSWLWMEHFIVKNVIFKKIVQKIFVSVHFWILSFDQIEFPSSPPFQFLILSEIPTKHHRCLFRKLSQWTLRQTEKQNCKLSLKLRKYLFAVNRCFGPPWIVVLGTMSEFDNSVRQSVSGKEKCYRRSFCIQNLTTTTVIENIWIEKDRRW